MPSVIADRTAKAEILHALLDMLARLEHEG
jgi:hypothetical protein